MEHQQLMYDAHPVGYSPIGPDSDSYANWLLQQGSVSQYFSAPPASRGGMFRFSRSRGGPRAGRAGFGNWRSGWCALGGILAVLAFFTYLAGISMGICQPLVRPRGVPRSARYVNVEEETWFDCAADTARNVDHCRAWDGTGRLIADGDYQLLDEKRAATSQELRPTWVVRGETKGGQVVAFAILQFQYDHRNSLSRPLVLTGFQDCLVADRIGLNVIRFHGCERLLQ